MTRELLEQRYVAAATTQGVGGATLKKLLERYGGIEQLWERLDDRSDPVVTRIAEHWAGKGRADAADIQRRTAAARARIYVWEDEDFPAALRDVSNPPCVLYVRGDLRRLTRRALAIVGSTEPLPAFGRAARRIAAACGEYSVQVVSGLAKGIDASALWAAVELGVPAFGVVGHGIDFEFPATSRPLYAELERYGAVISQFPTGFGPQRWTFPMRNELMCTLAYGTLIVQAHNKCGSRIQADFSFRHGRDVLIYAPNAELPDNEWFHELRSRGATIFHTFDEVLDVVALRHEQFRNLVPQAAEPLQSSLFDGPQNPGRRDGALLVDIDGVVTDTLAIGERAMSDAIAAVAPSPAPQIDVRGMTPWKACQELGLEWRRFNTTYDRLLTAALESKDVVRPEMRALLRRARERGWRIAAVTSQPLRRTRSSLKNDSELFEVLVTYNDTPKRAKPDPYPLELAAQRLGVTADRALVVGDSHADLLAARRAKMRSIAVLWGYEDAESLRRYSPDYVAATPDELEAILDGQLEPVA